ncbi:MAG: ABC transporter substrate-binding protein [Bauldia sp.]
MAAFLEGLAEQGWIEPDNLHVEFRFTAARPDLAAAAAAEVIALQPDAILANTDVNAAAVLALTSSIPVVFLPNPDPVAAGFVESYARPGRNATGFTNFEPTVSGKFMDLLLRLAPEVRRVGYLYNPVASPRQGEFYLAGFRDAAASFGVEPLEISVDTPEEIPGAITGLAAQPLAGLIVDADIFMWVHRRVVIAAVAEHRIPAIYPFVNYTDDGGLMSYSVNTLGLFRRGGVYVGRILNGANVSELPVQGPEEFQFVINLRTATAFGMAIPTSLLVIATRVIE